MSRYVGVTKARSDQLLRDMVQRGVLEPLAPTSVPCFSPMIMEACVHEAAHAVSMLTLGMRITSVTVSDTGSGLCKGEPRTGQGVPKPWEPLAIGHCASDLIGCIAVGYACGFRVETDDDFCGHGGGTDIANFHRRAAVLDCTPNQEAALRQAAFTRAREICNEYGEAIDAIADDLYVHHELGHDGVIRAVRRTTCAGHLLAAQMPTVAHRVPTPSPLKSVELWGHRLKDIGGGQVIVIDPQGRRSLCDNIYAAVYGIEVR